MAEEQDRTTVGGSELGHTVLKQLEADEVFPEMMDAYRFAIAVGLALRKRTPFTGRRTMFNIGSFDKDASVANLIQTLMPCEANEVYRAAEELAETGFRRIAPTVESGEFRFSDFLDGPMTASDSQEAR